MDTNKYDKINVSTDLDRFTGKKILIAEDEEINYLYLKAILKQFDFEVLHATNGYEAIAISRENPDIELIFMDIKMPELDGYMAFDRIRGISSQKSSIRNLIRFVDFDTNKWIIEIDTIKDK